MEDHNALLDVSRRIAAAELLLTGIVRGIEKNPGVMQAIEKTFAEFIAGTPPGEARDRIMDVARSMLAPEHSTPRG